MPLKNGYEKEEHCCWLPTTIRLGRRLRLCHKKFDVHMFNGEVKYSLYFHGNARFRDELVFSRENGLLLEHPITKGINSVYTFRGQSLSAPESARILLKLSEIAQIFIIVPTKTIKNCPTISASINTLCQPDQAVFWNKNHSHHALSASESSRGTASRQS